MGNDNRKEAEQKTEDSKQQAMKEAHHAQGDESKTIHTINPFTGTATDITNEDLEGVEKKIEADTERD